MRRRSVESAHCPVQAMGLTFPHPLGLAAGFDKNAVGIDGLAALGFGHVEIGTVTGEAQPGNPQPRLFRLKADRAIVNRMGFNNDGAEVVARRLAALARAGRRLDPVLGVNIGKTKVVPEEDAVARLREVAPGCSPPTPTTSSSTSPRPTRPACATCRPSRSSSPCWPPYAVAPTRRSPDAPGAAAGEDRARPQRRRRARGRRPRPGARASTGSSPPTPRSAATGWPAPRPTVEEIGAGGLSGRPLTAAVGGRRTPPARAGRSRPDAGRRRRHHHRRRRPPAARGRRGPAAGLHRVRLRGPAVAAAHRAGAGPGA